LLASKLLGVGGASGRYGKLFVNMSYTRRIAHNTIIQIVGKIISTITGLVIIAILTRYLGEEGFGHYYTVTVFLQLFGILVDLGLYIILVKKISEPNISEEIYVSNIFTLRLVSAIIFLGVAPFIVLFFPYPAVVKWGVVIATFSTLGVTLNQVLSGIFQKYLRMDRVVIAEVVGRLVLLFGTWLASVADAGLLWILGIVSLGSLVNFLLTYWYSRRLVKIKLAFDWTIWKIVFRESWPIALSIAFNLVYFKADTIILSLKQPAAAVGIYGAANKVLEVLVTFPAMFAGLVLPLLTAAWAMADKERFQRVLRKSFEAMVIVALPLVVGTYFIARPIMNIIAPEFTDAAAVLRVVIISTSIIFVGNLFGNAVVALNRQRVMMWLYLLVAIVSLIGYFLVIPIYSYFGAAWIRALSEFLVTISAAILVIRYTRVRLSLVVPGKALLASLVMGVALQLLAGHNFLISISIGAIVYGAALFFLKGVTFETIREIIKFRTVNH